MGVLLQSRSKTALLTLEKAVLSTSKDSKANMVKIKEHAGDFFYCENTVHQEFGPPSQTVNQHYYWKVLHLWEWVH
jgi:hypothetical protein